MVDLLDCLLRTSEEVKRLTEFICKAMATCVNQVSNEAPFDLVAPLITFWGQ